MSDVPITFFRSSSYNAFDFCEQRFFGEYILGWRGASNKKADKGTIVHKVMELLAHAKKAHQDGRDGFQDDEFFGHISSDIWGLDIDEITQFVYNYYTTLFNHHKWTKADFKECLLWVNKALEYDGGKFDPRNQNIVNPEIHFDLDIEEKWAEYEYAIGDLHLKGNLAIKGTIDLVTMVDDDTIEFVDYKGLAVDTPIPTIDGWKTMGELVVGDILFDKDGNQTKVIGKSKVKYKQCYKITFDDKSTVICDDEHLWHLNTNKIVKSPDLKVFDKIDLTKPIVCEEKELLLDPYVLGIWLGDGRNRGAEITSADPFIFEEIEKRGYVLGKDSEKRKQELQTRTILKTTHKLRKLNLLHNKHIPSIYLRASYKQRLDLLRGLMDSDGSVNSIRKQAVFSNCNKKLSDDVKELLLSLGQRVNQSDITTNTNFKSNVKIYPLHFRPININPFLLPRKADRIDPNWGSGKSHRREIKNIELLKEKLDTQCIMVDSPTNTYLCTKYMIPTHNTGKRLNWGNGKEKDYKSLNKDPQLMLYYYALSRLFPNVKYIQGTIYYINDGGPFTVFFDQSHKEKILELLKERFYAVRSTKYPALIRDRYMQFDSGFKLDKCKKFCHFGMNTFEGTHVKPLINGKDNYITKTGQKMTMCEQIRYVLEHRNVDSAITNMSADGHSVHFYKKPGSV